MNGDTHDAKKDAGESSTWIVCQRRASGICSLVTIIICRLEKGVAEMIIMINGAFGVGKTTVANML